MSGRPHLTRVSARLTLTLALALGVAACGHSRPGAVSVSAVSLSGRAAADCAAVVAAAPQRVAGQPARQTSPSSRYSAAWGDPAIVLTCSGTAPPALAATSRCFRVNGIDWLATQHDRAVDPSGLLTGDLTFTTIGRSAYVAVMVPDDYLGADALVDLTPAVKNGTTSTTPCV